MSYIYMYVHTFFSRKNSYHILMCMCVYIHIYIYIYIYIYMESRKIELMNLFKEKKWRHNCREWTYGHIRGRRGGANSESSIDIPTLSCIK